MNLDKFEISNFRIDKIEPHSIEIGNIFQKLCFDLLKSSYNNIFPLSNYRIILYPSNVSDGGIDISAENRITSQKEIYIQCKLGLNKKGAKFIINGLMNDFEKNLNKNIILKSYEPWIECNSISQYILCLGRVCNSVNISEECEKLLKDRFNDLFKKKLIHLQNIRIKLIFWNELKPILESDVYLYHKWIKSEPMYLNFINYHSNTADERTVIREYKDYLFERNLPYLPRNKFKSKLSVADRITFYDEEHLIEFLEKYSFHGLILHGQGGIGKTRLMYELGQIFIKKKYTVLEVDKNFEDIQSLYDYLIPEEKYLLLFDYIEEQNRFIEIAEWIFKNNKSDIKIIANCRNSYVIEIEQLKSKNYKLIDIGIHKINEKKYKEEIINSIINTINDNRLKQKLTENQNIKKFLLERPSFAVFIKYINAKNYTSEFNLKENEDFSNWLLRRLKLTLNFTLNYKELCRARKYIFQIFATLKADNDSRYKLKQKYKDDIDTLIDDGWIDEEQNSLSVVHDTVSDTLLSYYFTKIKVDEIAVESFLNFAMRVNSLSSCVRSLQRLFDQDLSDNKKESIKNYILNFIEKILTSELDTQTISFLVSFWLRQSNRPDVVKSLIKKILTYDLKYSIKANIIRNWVEKGNDIELIREYIPEILSKRINYKTASYIMGNWLEKGGSPIYIKSYMEMCLINNIDASLHSYLFKNWLEVGGDTDILINPLNRLLMEQQNNLTVSNVLKEYIVHNGNIEPINSNLIKWLRQRTYSNRTITVIGFWLEKLPDKNGINNVPTELTIIIRKVLKNFSHLRVTGNILGNWIIKGGELSIIQPYIKIWLSYNYDGLQAELIMSFWMMKGGNINELREFIQPCLKYLVCKERVEQDASRLMVNWLIHGDNFDILSPFISNWLDNFHELFEARFLITNWLEKTNDYILIKPYIKAWLNKQGQKKESLRIASFWLNKGDSIEEVTEYIKTTFYTLSHFEESHHVISYWLRKKGEPSLIKNSLLNYLYHNYNSINSEYVILDWIKHTHDPELIKEYILKIIEKCKIEAILNPFIDILEVNQEMDNEIILLENDFVDLERLDSRSLTLRIIDFIKNEDQQKKVTYDLQNYLKVKSITVGASQVYRRWIEYGNDFGLIKDYLGKWLKFHGNIPEASYVISEALSIKEGFEVVKKYAINWLNLFSQNENSCFVISSWLKGGGDHKVVKDWVKIWFEKHYEKSRVSLWRKEIINKCYKEFF